MSNFSAFKLFYDEFIYKNNSLVSYAKIDKNIENIKELISTIRNCSKIDVANYMDVLSKCNKKLKKELDSILSLNKTLMELYFLMYKARLDTCNDKINDLPLIISNSFYNDYRLDDKDFIELENSSNTIPKYSSLDKKEIREVAKDCTRFEFFITLLKESDNSKQYDKFLKKTNAMLALEPLYNENHFQYTSRLNPYINDYRELFEDFINKVKKTDDYEIISEKMRIAYRKKFYDWFNGISEILFEYYDSLFEKKENDYLIKNQFNQINDLSYESYLEVITDIEEEKDRLELAVKCNRFEPVFYFSDTAILNFRKVIINSYFDQKYYNEVVRGDIDSYVNRADELYGLSKDLEDQIMEYYLFTSSHSPRLKRFNDVNSAIIKKIYELYSPLDLLKKYNKEVEKFNKSLDGESAEFIKKYNASILGSKEDYGYKGSVPNANAIRIRVCDRIKNFILANCFTELFNRDTTGAYDTRNFDLTALVEYLNMDDILDLYSKLSVRLANKGMAQKFIAYGILYKNKNDIDLEKDFQKDLEKICDKYLGEEVLF